MERVVDPMETAARTRGVRSEAIAFVAMLVLLALAPTVAYPGFRAEGWVLPPDAEIVEALDAAHGDIVGGSLPRTNFPGTADGRYFAARGEDAIYFGPAGGNRDDEQRRRGDVGRVIGGIGEKDRAGADHAERPHARQIVEADRQEPHLLGDRHARAQAYRHQRGAPGGIGVFRLGLVRHLCRD